jgi:hypothetical protein
VEYSIEKIRRPIFNSEGKKHKLENFRHLECFLGFHLVAFYKFSKAPKIRYKN